MLRSLPIFLALLLATACVSVSISGSRGGEHEFLALVETAPVETTLGHSDLPETHLVWREMIEAAREEIVLAHFYASDREGSRLQPVVRALEAAATRGVRVRFLADAGFHATYPDTLDRLGAAPGIELRLLDLEPVTGGVLHAKYLVVDGRELWLGSANFDWRALEHIQELGVRVESAPLAEALAEVFAHDWALAVGEEPAPPDLPARPRRVTLASGDHVLARLVASPRSLVDGDDAWDLPALVDRIDRAEDTVRVQLLSYSARGRDGERFSMLDEALRRAAARGVEVRLLLADWCAREGTIDGLQDLQRVPGVEVRLVSLPESSTGFIPFARVVHAKYLAVDGRWGWLGTSNWSRDYFHASRNVGILVEGAPFARRLERFFDDGWTSEYASTVDPDARYEPPRIDR